MKTFGRIFAKWLQNHPQKHYVSQSKLITFPNIGQVNFSLGKTAFQKISWPLDKRIARFVAPGVWKVCTGEVMSCVNSANGFADGCAVGCALGFAFGFALGLASGFGFAFGFAVGLSFCLAFGFDFGFGILGIPL